MCEFEEICRELYPEGCTCCPEECPHYEAFLEGKSMSLESDV